MNYFHYILPYWTGYAISLIIFIGPQIYSYNLLLSTDSVGDWLLNFFLIEQRVIDNLMGKQSISFDISGTFFDITDKSVGKKCISVICYAEITFFSELFFNQ